MDDKEKKVDKKNQVLEEKENKAEFPEIIIEENVYKGKKDNNTEQINAKNNSLEAHNDNSRLKEFITINPDNNEDKEILKLLHEIKAKVENQEKEINLIKQKIQVIEERVQKLENRIMSKESEKEKDYE